MFFLRRSPEQVYANNGKSTVPLPNVFVRNLSAQEEAMRGTLAGEPPAAMPSAPRIAWQCLSGAIFGK